MNGIVIIDKPVDMTSYDVIRSLKRIFDTKKIGHGGTLDPFASGLLVIAINDATKIIRYFLDGDKEYTAKLKFGEMTDSYDRMGKVISTSDAPAVSEDTLRGALNGFRGETMQTPPMFSAKKRDGVKLYELARQGIEVDRVPVKVVIKELELVDYSFPYAEIRVLCSKGTYIRSLANDIGIALGTYAHLTELRRTKSSQFDIGRAYRLDDLLAAKDDGRLNECMINMNDALSFIPAVTVDDDVKQKIRHGVQLSDEDVKRESGDKATVGMGGGLLKVIADDGELIALIRYADEDIIGEEARKYKYERVFLK